MVLLETQEQLDSLATRFGNDDDYFIREAHILSPSYVTSDGKFTVAPDSIGAVRLLISTQEEDRPGLEMLFHGVKEFRVDFRMPFALCGTVVRSHINDSLEITVCFAESGHSRVVAGSCFFQELGVDSWGYKLRYGHENLFDEGGIAISAVSEKSVRP